MSYWIKYRLMEQNRICKSYIWEGTLDTGGERKNSLMHLSSVRFSSFTQSCPTLCDPMGCSTPGFPAHHQLLELAQTHVHRLSDAIQPSHPLLSPSPPEKQKCLRYSYQPQGDHVLIQIWTKKQLCNKKLSQPVGVYIVRYITLKC